MIRVIHSEEVNGVDLDQQTRCSHYHSDLDIIAIKFKCCGRWFPCFDCHTETTDHKPHVWPSNKRETKAILCGSCGHHLSIAEYLGCDSKCPACAANFNPGCAAHYNFYFDL